MRLAPNHIITSILMSDLTSLSEQKLQMLIANAPVGVAEIDETGKVSWINVRAEFILQGFIDCYGHDLKNIFPLLRYISPEIEESIKDYAQETGIIILNRIYVCSLVEQAETVEKHFTVTVNKMSPGQIIVALDDVSENVSQEKKIRQTLLDKAVEQGKFEIASGMLHDIGNAVVGFGSYLMRIRRLQEKSDLGNLENLYTFLDGHSQSLSHLIGKEKSDAVLTLLQGAVLSMQNTKQELNNCITEQFNIITHIQEILSIQRQYSVVEQNQQRSPVNLRSIINDCMAMLFATIDKKQITVSLDLALDVPLINGDRTKLMQVILNIIKNSIESFAESSPVKEIFIRLFSVSEFVVIEIKDSGMGFDEETGARLFDRGFTTKLAGSGLGLSNCRSIIDSHSGSISLNSPGVALGAVCTINFKII